jgi:xanthine dehydrogenase accessory factor
VEHSSHISQSLIYYLRTIDNDALDREPDRKKQKEKERKGQTKGNYIVQDLFRELIADLANGETVAVATIIRRKGSVPREVGAKMLVHRGGRISGTVGGGCGEAEVWRSALNVIDTRRPSTVQVDLTEEIAMESQGVCGGIFDVFVQPWFAHAQEQPQNDSQRVQSEQCSMPAIAQAIDTALTGERAVALLTVVAAGNAWRSTVGQHMLVHEDGSLTGYLAFSASSDALLAQLTTSAGQAINSGKSSIEKVTGPENNWAEVFVEPFLPPPVLLIAGAGHIAVPLAGLAHLMRYSVSITDDRASFANRERFPNANKLLVGDIQATLREYPISPRTHIVLVTRAHAHDVQGLRAIIDSPAAYIGMIGSQRRIWAVFKLLHEEGVPAEKLMRVRAPIGLDLGGATPEEIALAIMSEITLLHHSGSGVPMSDPLRARFISRLQRMDDDFEN